MTTKVHDITDLPKNSSQKKIKKGVAIGVFAAGTLLLVDDLVKKFGKKNRTVETTEA